MAQGPNGPQVPPADDLYTTLLIVAAGMLLIGIIFLAVRTVGLYEALLPPGGL
jgi:hypothetical protein